ncbi:MIP/aquaporin family protein [Halalkalibacterium halodurans]|uniref:hypothetical protein n=1 Tax=Halalkalibacterium halodurans TaxID=86665 RepID=UPI002AAA439B|nr:hypothetical protein [Halalkalibacterium halodurans]MDY7224648.1 hypothetical protein [Halalkalibacterium halodurans]MDY7243245.1 hypothetical protein [Halalkalibacterium halodurans]
MTETIITKALKRKKLLVLFIIFTLVITPITVNFIMNLNFSVAGDENHWIPFFGSYIGAIVGGIISGTLTLMGVLLTIKDSEKIRKKDEFPVKIDSLENIIEITDDNIKKLDYYTRLKDPFDLQPRKLKLFIIDHNLEIQETAEFKELTDSYLNRIKPNVLRIDAHWYKEFFRLRQKLNCLKSQFKQNEDLHELWEEAQDNVPFSDDVQMTWREYALKFRAEYYKEIHQEVADKEFYLVSNIIEVISDFKLKAEMKQLNLLVQIKDKEEEKEEFKSDNTNE